MGHGKKLKVPTFVSGWISPIETWTIGHEDSWTQVQEHNDEKNSATAYPCERVYNRNSV